MSASEDTEVSGPVKTNDKGRMRKWLIPIVAVATVAIVLAATLLVYYSPDHSWDASIRDHDGDGYADDSDAFPYDATEWVDTDVDGYGDSCDCFPADPHEWEDGDDDGYGDNGDDFPTEPTQWIDSDGDGYGDNIDGSYPDLFPDDSTEWNDTDGDGCGDNSDAFPEDSTQWSDRDGDGHGDNATGTSPDEFPDDVLEWNDADDDGVGDNADSYDFGDGKIRVFVDYYQEDGSADFWSYGDPFFVIRFDTNFDGMWDYSAQSQVFLDVFSLSHPFSSAIDYPDAYPPAAITFTIEVYESDLEGNYQVDYNPAVGGSYWTAQTAYWPYANSWYLDGSADGGYEQDCILQFSIYISG